MRVLVVGEGGREDALVWALSRSPDVRLLACAPGSAAMGRRCRRVAVASGDWDAVGRHAEAERYDLVVVGPEAPLVAGLSDRLRRSGIAVFGPSAAAAEIEGSKVFAKEFMARHGIPTARFRVADDVEEARRVLSSGEFRFPVVLKADGLASGKGVVVAPDLHSASETAAEMLSGRAFGAAGSKIVVEEFLAGREVSVFVLADGEGFVDLATCQDYKRALDGDRGPNTGGMGSYSPSVWLDDSLRARISQTVIAPTLAGLAREGRPYRGVLYVGLMLGSDGPRVLEYNARFGDPETQALLPRLEGDWLPLLLGAAAGGLSGLRPRWKEEASVCVVLASEGYPGSSPKGIPIEGLEEAEAVDRVLVFHAGTDRHGSGPFVTRGGRVLGVTGLASDLAGARDLAYAAAARIRWPGMHLRRDIALDAMQHIEGGAKK